MVMDGWRQYNVLFPDLTVEEHLYLFASFKGGGGSGNDDDGTTTIKSQVERMLEDVALTNKRNTLSKNLSGGKWCCLRGGGVVVVIVVAHCTAV